MSHAQDGVELGAALRDATVAAKASWAEMSAGQIEATLRNFERRRSTRVAPLIAKARGNIRRLRGFSDYTMVGTSFPPPLTLMTPIPDT